MNSFKIWIIFFCFGTVNTAGSPLRYQITKNYEYTFTNGPGGECELSSPATRSGKRSGPREVICPTNWVPNGTIASDRKQLRNKRKCRYGTKSNRFLCFGSEEGKNGSFTCLKTVSYYIVTKPCSDTWLAWEACDKSCNGGVTKRVKFSLEKNKYDKAIEYRPCNTHECPRWGVWRPQKRGNYTIPCDKSNCTRMWERDCIFKNMTVPPALCAGEGFGIENERRMDCWPEECDEVTTNRQTESSKSSLDTTTRSDGSKKPKYLRSTSLTRSEATLSTEDSASLNSRGSSVIAPETGNKIWEGFGIGFLTSLFLFAMALLARRQWFHRKSGIDSRKWDSSRTDSSRQSATTPFRLERIAVPSVAAEEGVYSTVEQLTRQTTRNQNIYEVEADVLNNSPSIDNSAYIEPSDENALDPLYSAIPAYELNAGECYPSSEFDSSAEESASEARSSRLPSSEIEKNEFEFPALKGERAEEGCKSFDSDEDRDIVHTLRKQSIKNKRTTDGLEDVFLSDDEMGKEQHETERKFAFSRRYSKILARKARKSLSWGRNEPVEAGFKWVDGRRLTASTNSDCSTPSTSQVCESEAASESRMLPRKCSLGAFNSVVSVNADGATSGYNSAMGDSTDDERSMWITRRMTNSHTPSRNHGIKLKDSIRNHRHSSRERISVFATERRNHFGGFRPGPQHSYICSEFHTRSNDSPHGAENPRENAGVRPFNTVRPTSHKSRSLISRQGRIIPVEDIYSSPIDSEPKGLEKSEHWEYELPVDALQNKSVVI